MVCVPAPGTMFPTQPYVIATRMWAQGVETQLTIMRSFYDLAKIANPFLPVMSPEKIAAHTPKPRPAARKRVAPTAKVAVPAPKPAPVTMPAPAAKAAVPETTTTPAAPAPAPTKQQRRKRKAPTKPEQPFKD